MKSSLLTLKPTSHPPKNDPIGSNIILEGSKSYANRALLIASLAWGESRLRGLPMADDVFIMLEALRSLGVSFQWDSTDLLIQGTGGLFPPFKGKIDVGAAGTAMRFLLPLACLIDGSTILLDGTPRMRQRPIGDLVDALRTLGAEIHYERKKGFPPIRITGVFGELMPLHTSFAFRSPLTIKTDTSSQFTSALLMIAPYLPEGLHLQLQGPSTSQPYIDMTVAIMQDFGVTVIQNLSQRTYIIEKAQRYQARDYIIEKDLSAASYFWGIAALTGRKIRLFDIPHHSQQGDLAFLNILTKMGARVAWGIENDRPYVDVWRENPLQSIDIDMSQIPDLVPTLAVISTIAKGTTRLKGLANLRYKETDRLDALQHELSALKIANHIEGDSLIITGGSPQPATIHTYDDHRIAMAFAMLGSLVDGITIEHPHVVSKSFPSFWQELFKLGLIEKK